MEGKGGNSWLGEIGICAGEQENERGQVNIVVLLNMQNSDMIESGCVSNRILWVKFTLLVFVVYTPTEGDKEQMEKFLSDFGNWGVL